MITHAEHHEPRDILRESEITYRMERLRGEADRARLAAAVRAAGTRSPRHGLRRFVGRALIALGELLEKRTPCPDERTGPAGA